MANPTFTLIASNTVGSGGASSVTFSSIPATYTDLVVKVSARLSANDSLLMLFNGSSSGYTQKFLEGNGATASSGPLTNGYISYPLTTTASTFSNVEIYIPNYTSSNYKSYSTDSVDEANATTAYADLLANLWSNTSAISSIAFSTATSTTIQQYSTFSLYGINNS
jgi:hypothetical protein